MHSAWLVVIGAAAMAATAGGSLAATPESIFAKPSPLFLHAPQFDKIKDADYLPAIEEGMAIQRREIDAIVNQRSVPTFENTIVAMERSGQMLDRASSAFYAVAHANGNPTLEKVETDIAPKLAAQRDAIYLNPRLFQRVKSLHDRKAELKLGKEESQLLDLTYDNFVRAGANLSDADKTRLKALNEQISSLETAFQQKLLAAAKAGGLVIEDKAKLAGLSDQEVSGLAEAAEARELKGKWVIPLQNTTQQPLLASLSDRSTREALFNAGWTRAERGDANDTRATILALTKLRIEKAKLLGFKTFADYALQDQMAKTPEAVKAFMAQLTPAARARAGVEAADIQKMIEQGGENFELKPWDWDRYAERVRKAKYDLNNDEVKPYFELNRVLRDGVLYAAAQLYGISFHERKDIPVYHPDVLVFEVRDKDGSVLGLMYFDYFKRDNKNGGAWMSNMVGQSKLLGTKPVVYNVANLTKPGPGQPALISFDDVTTMFHEFGHALHGLFADQTYPTLSGTNVARDYVEFPSQFNENWALYPSVLANYAKHYQTGAAIPQALVDKIKAASKFNKGYEMGELIAAAELDMQWHSIAGAAPSDVDAFETQALKAAGVDIPNVPPRYRTSYFLHIWANGYSAGYYAYLWTQLLADDSWAWFNRNGGLTRANGQRFRDLILSKGHTEDYGPMFRAFYGKDLEIGPMLENRGLAPEPK